MRGVRQVRMRLGAAPAARDPKGGSGLTLELVSVDDDALRAQLIPVRARDNEAGRALLLPVRLQPLAQRVHALTQAGEPLASRAWPERVHQLLDGHPAAACADQIAEQPARAMVEPLAAQIRTAALHPQRSERGDAQRRG